MVKTHYGWLISTILSTTLVMCFALVCIYIGGVTAIYADGFFFAMVCSFLPIYPISVAFSVMIGGLNMVTGGCTALRLLSKRKRLEWS